jgi:hypothetical protein
MDKIKNALHRTTQTVNEKLGKAEATNDEEYDLMHKQFVNSLAVSESFSKHVQQLVENFSAMTAVLTFVCEDLNDLYSKSDDVNKRQLAEEIMAVSVEIEKKGVLKFQEQVVANIVTPINEYISRFDNVKQLHKQRCDLVKEYDYHRNRVQKMSETQSKDPLKLPKEKELLRVKKEDMETVVNLTKEKMRELIDVKPVVFSGVSEQTIGSLIYYYDAVKRAFDKLKRFSAEPLAGSAKATSVETPQAQTTKQKSLPTLQPQQQQVGSASFKVPPKYDCEWHYLDSDVNQQGPFNFMQLKAKFKQGIINNSTHVFGGDMSDWQTISDTPELFKALSA